MLATLAGAVVAAAGIGVGATLLLSGSGSSSGGTHSAVPGAAAPAAKKDPQTLQAQQTPKGVMGAYTSAVNSHRPDLIAPVMCGNAQYGAAAIEAWEAIGLNDHLDAGTPQPITGGQAALLKESANISSSNGDSLPPLYYDLAVTQENGLWCVVNVKATGAPPGSSGGGSGGSGGGAGSGGGSDGSGGSAGGGSDGSGSGGFGGGGSGSGGGIPTFPAGSGGGGA